MLKDVSADIRVLFTEFADKRFAVGVVVAKPAVEEIPINGTDLV